MGIVIIDEIAELIPTLERLVAEATGTLVVGLTDYNAALVAVERSDLQALIVDVGGPDVPGLSLIRAARSKSTKRPFILASTTAAFPESSPEAAYKAGADRVLSRPFSPTEFATALTQGLALGTEPDVLLLRAGVESPGLDYKESLSLSTADGRAALAKDVIAMANYGGGVIIVGMREIQPGTFEPIGVPVAQLSEYETTRLNKAVRDFMDPPVSIRARRVSDNKKTFVILEIPTAGNSVILVARENVTASLYSGRVYSRSTASESAEVRTALALHEILDRVLAARAARRT
jgi:CheY-like chemotaxis protein